MKKSILGIPKKDLTKQDGCLSGIIKIKQLEQINQLDAFELLKVFIGTENPYYRKLSSEDLTLVKPGISVGGESLKYVYNWGSSLIQIRFYSITGKLHFSVKFLE